MKRADIGSFFAGDLFGRGSACCGDGCGGGGGAFVDFDFGCGVGCGSFSRTGLGEVEEAADDEVTDEEVEGGGDNHR